MISMEMDGVQKSGLIVQKRNKGSRVLGTFIKLMLNYQYGLSVMGASDVGKGASVLLKHGVEIGCVVVIQDQKIIPRKNLSALGRNGEIPLFLVFPEKFLVLHHNMVEGLPNIHLCAWEKAFGKTEESLRQKVAEVFSYNGIGALSEEIKEGSYEVLQQRVAQRLQGLKTLPTLPEIVLRIMRLVGDPKSTTEQLEQVLCQDPAIVMKLLQMAKSPAFAATDRAAKWTLGEIIVRLGQQKVGSIAMQIKIINSFALPKENGFDLRRFWEHSVGTAVVADWLYTQKLLPQKTAIEFNDYWIAALLHDVGKLVLGCFFWDWYEKIVERAQQENCDFREIEERVDEGLRHEHVGKLLLLHENMGSELVRAVDRHHTLDESPGELTCLVHVANNLCKDLGKGCLPDERGIYNELVLRKLEMTEKDVRELKASLGDDLFLSIEEMVKQCI